MYAKMIPPRKVPPPPPSDLEITLSYDEAGRLMTELGKTFQATSPMSAELYRLILNSRHRL
jgi:hypothetical protein